MPFRRMFRRIMKRKLHEQHKKDDFDARLQMEKNAQREIAARLQSLEIIADNQLRRRGRSRGSE